MKLILTVMIVLFLTGCFSLITEYRKDGFNMYSRSFTLIPDTPYLHKTIILNNIEIHIVGDRSKFDYERARKPENRITGYTRVRDGVYEIWVLGKVVNNKVIINQAVLGHELNHILEFKDKSITNPDTLETIGL